MSSQQLSLSTTNTLYGLTIKSTEERFTIDLMGTQLSFDNPKSNLKESEFLWGFQLDRRPFVNTITKAAYQYHPQNQRANCDIYQTGWTIFTRKWWKKFPQGVLKLSVSLVSPAAHEYDEFPNLFEEPCLKTWLALYYRDRQEILGRTSFTDMPDGSIEVFIADENPAQTMAPESVPLQPIPEPVSGLPGYFVFLNPGIVEFNIPIGQRDVLQMRFQLKCFATDTAMVEQLKTAALDYANHILKSVEIDLSAAERKHTTQKIAAVN